MEANVLTLAMSSGKIPQATETRPWGTPLGRNPFSAVALAPYLHVSRLQHQQNPSSYRDSALGNSTRPDSILGSCTSSLSPCIEAPTSASPFDPSRMIGIIRRKALIKDLAAVYHAECLTYCQELLELQSKVDEPYTDTTETKTPLDSRKEKMRPPKRLKKSLLLMKLDLSTCHLAEIYVLNAYILLGRCRVQDADSLQKFVSPFVAKTLVDVIRKDERLVPLASQAKSTHVRSELRELNCVQLKGVR
ncbi:unnamed protein product [Fraxinus pennsylvanica]|uniref:Uncharacterized protein n=1 Tax=Fraxinus pennsylvanica TaxID=56036 RepID=A0AAD1ZP45_9LAMI|nr:unnamed protein product [Fraxinus pennsylvanica]